MTHTWTLPIKLPIINSLKGKQIKSLRDIYCIIPVKDDISGLELTLDSLTQLKELKKIPQIIIIDDGSENKTEFESLIKKYDLPIKLVHNYQNHGPAYARNRGAYLVRKLTKKTDTWLWFTDAGCTFSTDLLDRYIKFSQDNLGLIYTGKIKSKTSHIISKYYEEQKILEPPFQENQPQAIITANVIIHQSLFWRLQGFDIRFDLAAAEDLDFGMRARFFTEIKWVEQAIVYHSFSNNLTDFKKRFYRYGQGLSQLAQKWHLDLNPQPFLANNPSKVNNYLASLEYEYLTKGYQSHKNFSNFSLDIIMNSLNLINCSNPLVLVFSDLRTLVNNYLFLAKQVDDSALIKKAQKSYELLEKLGDEEEYKFNLFLFSIYLSCFDFKYQFPASVITKTIKAGFSLPDNGFIIL